MDEVEPSPLFDFHAQLIKVRNSVHTQEHIHQNTKALPPQKLQYYRPLYRTKLKNLLEAFVHVNNELMELLYHKKRH